MEAVPGLEQDAVLIDQRDERDGCVEDAGRECRQPIEGSVGRSVEDLVCPQCGKTDGFVYCVGFGHSSSPEEMCSPAYTGG